jgi:hypothetical protein
MNIGIDFHDTLSYKPEFFKGLFKVWPGNIYIISGTPKSQRKEITDALTSYGISDKDYVAILLGYDYDKQDMSLDHFTRMKEYKLNLIKEYNIQVYFDDNPFYASYLKDHTTLFQTILNKDYLKEFSNKDPFFTCNFQVSQFDFLDELTDSKIKKVLHG